MKFILATFVGMLALLLPVVANPIDNIDNAAAICAKGFCTSCPLPENQCTVVTRRHGNTLDAYIYRWDCTLAGNVANVNTGQSVLNMFSQLRYVVVMEQLGGNPIFHYAGGFYSHPNCFSSFGTWQCVQQFYC